MKPNVEEILAFIEQGKGLDPETAEALRNDPDSQQALRELLALRLRLRRVAGDTGLPVSFSDIADYEAGCLANAQTRRKVEDFLRDHPEYGSGQPPQPPAASRPARTDLLKRAWPSVVAIFLCLAVASVLGVQVTRLNARADRLESEKGQQEVLIRTQQDTIREQEEGARAREARLNRLEHEIQALGLTSVVTLKDLYAFEVEPGSSRLRFAGSFNPRHIKQVRFRWGVEPDGTFLTLGKNDLSPDPHSGCVAFNKVSDDLPLKNQMVVAVLEFVPEPEMAQRFPEYFTPERLQFRRNFFLGKDGILADVEPVVVLEPRPGATVGRTGDVAGQLKGMKGWPVVFIRGLGAEDAWYAQAPVKELDAQGRFSIRGFFGGPGVYPPGAQFRVVVLVAPDREAAGQFKVGREYAALPEGLPKSRSVTVTRE
jgi:hypothetical protein